MTTFADDGRDPLKGYELPWTGSSEDTGHTGNPRSIAVWNKVLDGVLKNRCVRVDRANYLRREFSKHCSPEIVEASILTTPARAGIPASVITSTSDSSIAWHESGVTSASFFAGLPGGWWMAGTIPVDMAQFYGHAIIIMQKLLYLYGWPELMEEDKQIDDKTRLLVTMFIGAMLGNETAATALKEFSEHISIHAAKKLSRQPLTHYAIYNMIKEVAKWMGFQINKKTFSEGVTKIVPVVGGFASAGITYASFHFMCGRLIKHLQQLRPHTEDGGGDASPAFAR